MNRHNNQTSPCNPFVPAQPNGTSALTSPVANMEMDVPSPPLYRSYPQRAPQTLLLLGAVAGQVLSVVRYSAFVSSSGIGPLPLRRFRRTGFRPMRSVAVLIVSGQSRTLLWTLQVGRLLLAFQLTRRRMLDGKPRTRLWAIGSSRCFGMEGQDFCGAARSRRLAASAPIVTPSTVRIIHYALTPVAHTLSGPPGKNTAHGEGCRTIDYECFW